MVGACVIDQVNVWRLIRASACGRVHVVLRSGSSQVTPPVPYKPGARSERRGGTLKRPAPRFSTDYSMEPGTSMSSSPVVLVTYPDFDAVITRVIVLPTALEGIL